MAVMAGGSLRGGGVQEGFDGGACVVVDGVGEGGGDAEEVGDAGVGQAAQVAQDGDVSLVVGQVGDGVEEVDEFAQRDEVPGVGGLVVCFAGGEYGGAQVDVVVGTAGARVRTRVTLKVISQGGQ
ncbi:hypothetical protein ACLGIH_00230 [Streptomyces sp. HMX87]|uniref:hypothetical protein n=1 Tax=Streptomyces sp. HMX87 TaxID=3390849 RepID=UPI003A879341